MAGGQERGRQPEEHTSCPGSALLDMNQLPESSKQRKIIHHTQQQGCVTCRTTMEETGSSKPCHLAFGAAALSFC